MPSMPKWINNAVESLLSSKFREVEVIATEYITESVKNVRFTADLHGLEFLPGYAVAFRVNEQDYRNYTPYNFDKVNSCFDILFHLHGDAPGNDFAQALSVNNCHKMLIPRGRELFKRNFACHISIGDETSLGTALAIKAEAEKYGSVFTGIFELGNHEILQQLELYGSHISKNDPKEITKQLVSLIGDGAIIPSETVFYITGNGKTLQAVRSFLKQAGVASDQIITQAYWIAGKTGL